MKTMSYVIFINITFQICAPILDRIRDFFNLFSHSIVKEHTLLEFVILILLQSFILLLYMHLYKAASFCSISEIERLNISSGIEFILNNHLTWVMRWSFLS